MAEDGPLSQADIDALTAGLLGGDAGGGGGFKPEAIRDAVEAILDQGTTVIGTLLNKAIVLSCREIREASLAGMADGFAGESLLMRMGFEQGFGGELGLLFRKETAALLANLMVGGDSSAEFKDEDMDALNELGNQFMGSVCTALGSRYHVSLSTSQAHSALFDGNEPPFTMDGSALIEVELSIEGAESASMRMILSEALVASLGGQGAGGGHGSSREDHDSLGMLSTQGGFGDSMAQGLAESPPNVQMLLDINLNVTIELGRTRLSIRKVLELGPGSIIELDRLAGEPVDLLVNDKVVAKGEVVVVDEYFGIRIISLVSPEERIKQLK